jgi:hypothetical protein
MKQENFTGLCFLFPVLFLILFLSLMEEDSGKVLFE